MDVDTGEVLALASNPTFDPDVYVGRIEEKELSAARGQERQPPDPQPRGRGRLSAGVDLQAVRRPRRSAGGPAPARRDHPVHGQGGHRRPDLHELGSVQERADDACRPRSPTPATPSSTTSPSASTSARTRRSSAGRGAMGFGAGTGIDVGPEAEGLVPTPNWRRRTFKTEIDRIWTSGDSVQLAIGQGDLLVSPLQMTRGYAMIANGGKLVEPHLVKSVEEPRNEGEPPVVLRPYTPKPARDLGLDPYALSVVQEALYDATHASYGTSQQVFGELPDLDRRQDRHGREVRRAAWLHGPARPVLVVRLRPVRGARGRRLRADRERRPRRHGGGAGGAQGLREVLQRQARQRTPSSSSRATRTPMATPSTASRSRPARRRPPGRSARSSATSTTSCSWRPAAWSPTGSGCSSR